VADNVLLDSVIRAIVYLNFNETDAARDTLLVALSNYNFAHTKEITDGNRPAAA
jgi:hypothetical protein